MAELRNSKIDIKMVRGEDGLYDMALGDDGDLLTTAGVETSLLMSFFAERRADASEVAVPFLRRGWWGNAVTSPDDFEVGSKLWLLYDARAVPETASRAEDYTRQAYQWLINDQIFRRLDVGSALGEDSVTIDITLFNAGNNIETLHFDLLNDTVKELAQDAP